MVKRSKKYREAAERVDRNNLYTANEAIALLKSMPAYNQYSHSDLGGNRHEGTQPPH